MASTPAGTALTVAHRAAQLAVRAGSLRDLLTLWQVVDPANLSETIDVFTQAAVLLAMQGHDDSAGKAAAYFGLFRTAEGATSPYAAAVAARPSAAAVAGELRGAALKGIIDARKAGQTLAGSRSNGLVKVAGALVKVVLGGGRMTVIDNANRDRQALGWQRVTSGSPCTFCRTVAARGPVYRSQRSADFLPHDNCGCMAEALYRRSGVNPQSARYKVEYDKAQEWAGESGNASSGTSNNLLNNYRRWLAAGSPEPGGRTVTVSPVTTPDGGSA